MGWLTALFSSEEIVKRGAALVDDTIRGVGTWIDEWNLTDEEKMKYRIKTLSSYQAFLDKRLEESSIRTISRRAMAWGIMGTFLTFFSLGAVSWFLDPAWSGFLIQWFQVTGMDTLVLSVGAFYFGTHLISAIKGPVKDTGR